MRTQSVVPMKKELQFALQTITAKRNDEFASAVIFHGQNETLNDSDAAVLANGSKSRRNLMRLAPSMITFVFPKLRAFVGDQILGRCFELADYPAQQSADGSSTGLTCVDRKPSNPT